MILEFAVLEAKPGQADALGSAILRGARTVVSRAAGMRQFRLMRGIESPARYILEVTWDSIEAHEQGFRQSPLLQEWRDIVSPYLSGPPAAQHYQFIEGGSNDST